MDHIVAKRKMVRKLTNLYSLRRTAIVFYQVSVIFLPTDKNQCNQVDRVLSAVVVLKVDEKGLFRPILASTMFAYNIRHWSDYVPTFTNGRWCSTQSTKVATCIPNYCLYLQFTSSLCFTKQRPSVHVQLSSYISLFPAA